MYLPKFMNQKLPIYSIKDRLLVNYFKGFLQFPGLDTVEHSEGHVATLWLMLLNSFFFDWNLCFINFLL